METRVLHYFLTIARLGTISAAARELHVAQPTLSRQIQQLEEQLDTTLFIRERRRMVLTKAGMAYQIRVQQILIELERANQVAAAINNDSLTGRVGIGCVESTVTKFLIPELAHFHHDYPQVQIELYDAEGETIKERLDRGSLEVGIVSTPISTAKYHTRQLPVVDRWGVAVPTASPLSRQSTITIDQLATKPVIIPQRSLIHDELNDWLESATSSLVVKGTANLLTNATYLAQAGVGNLICIEGAPLPPQADLTFIPFNPIHEQKHFLIWRKNAVLSAPAERLITQICDHLDNQ